MRLVHAGFGLLLLVAIGLAHGAVPAPAAADAALLILLRTTGKATPTESALRACLPPDLRDVARFEALPALRASLLHAPASALPRAVDALRADAASKLVAYVEMHGIGESVGDDVPMLASDATVTTAQPRPLALGIVDLGLDRSHPLLRSAFGRLHFQPGTPGADGSGRLLRSHGTAMAGVYAQLLAGRTLDAGGLEQHWLRLPRAVALTDTLVAHAGPETRAGRTQLARALEWMLTPSAARPLPDVLNYSQGNGRLCDAGACDPTAWSGVTRLLDRIVDERGITVVKSAGNQGDRDDNTMTVPGDSYNAITVGNMHAFDWQRCAASADRYAHKVYRTSSVAPAAPAPRLLDLVAPGVRIATTGVDPAYCRQRCVHDTALHCTFCTRLGRAAAPGDGHWKLNSGTSPAAAIVGAFALYLADTGLRDPRAIRALLVNSADAWTSRDAPHPRVRGSGAGCMDDVHARLHGPWPYGAHYDRSYGWGYFNPARAEAMRRHTRVDEITAGGERCYDATLDAWDKITLTWHRHVGDGDGLPLTQMHLALNDAETGRLIDADRHRADDNLRQVSNGRGRGASAVRRAVVVRVTSTAQETYGLASATVLTARDHCPPVEAARSAQ